MRRRWFSAALGIAALLAGAAAWPGVIHVNYYSSNPQDHLYAYAYQTAVSGYPPVPHEVILIGRDMLVNGQYQQYYWLYFANIDSFVLEPGHTYAFRIKRYVNYAEGPDLQPNPIADGYTTAQ